jgi:hypothetical protein
LVCFSKSFTMCDRWSRKWRSARSREVEVGNDVRETSFCKASIFSNREFGEKAPISQRRKQNPRLSRSTPLRKNFRLERFRDPR